MTERTPELQRFFDLVRDAIRLGTAPTEPAALAAERIFTALERPALEDSAVLPARLPVCRHLDTALAAARTEADTVANVAGAFAAIVPRLAWQRRAGAGSQDGAFSDNHGNAVIAGPDGLERRGDVRIGVSLLASKVRYPDHRHPPEELYLVLSRGEWRQEDGPWHEPGPGGLVHNPPNILHAMRSAEAPLLAIWCLWLGDR